jgi:hypothetical protein
MARQAGSKIKSFLDPKAFAADASHYPITYERLADGLVESRRWLGLTFEEAAEQARISAVLDKSNGTIGGLTPHSLNASIWDERPPSVFLVSLDGPADRLGNDAAAFFGAGGRSAPTTLVEQAFEGSADRKLPWSLNVTGDRSGLLLARRVRDLRPGASVTMRFLWGYEPGGRSGPSPFRDRLVAKYRAAGRQLQQQNAALWHANGLRFETEEVRQPSFSVLCG